MNIFGLTSQSLKKISKLKNDPSWMLKIRQSGLLSMQKQQKHLENYGLDDIDNIKIFSDERSTFNYIEPIFINAQNSSARAAQQQSKIVYLIISEQLKKKGVIYESLEDGTRNHPELVSKYLTTVISPDNNVFAAMNTAFWSGGVFLYIPKGVKVELPVQALYYIKSQNFGQFERTLIIVDENAELDFYEGCVAEQSSINSLHAGVVEIIIKKNGLLKYTTIQNWSKTIKNYVTKSTLLEENAKLIWIDGNIGSSHTIKYPSAILKGDHSSAEFNSFSFATSGQTQTTGAKAYHYGKHTTSSIISKSVCIKNGKSVFKGLIDIKNGAVSSKSYMRCDSLITSAESNSQSFPSISSSEPSSSIEHEATISSIDSDQLYYLNSRGLSNEQAKSLIINGYIKEFSKNLNSSYQFELNKMLELFITEEGK